jgi:hypothetical protein
MEAVISSQEHGGGAVTSLPKGQDVFSLNSCGDEEMEGGPLSRHYREYGEVLMARRSVDECL